VEEQHFTAAQKQNQNLHFWPTLPEVGILIWDQFDAAAFRAVLFVVLRARIGLCAKSATT
jgi:hypothetical protein